MNDDGYRKKPYKVDSTKGASIINPLNYKGDVLVQVWMDSRVLATVSNWLDMNGTYTRFMSQAVRRPLELLVDNLVNNGDVALVDDTNEARRLLERKYGVQLNRGDRGGKNILHNQILSDRRIRATSSQRRPDANVAMDSTKTLKSEEIERLTKIFSQTEDRSMEEVRDEATQNARDSGLIVEEPQTIERQPTVMERVRKMPTVEPTDEWLRERQKKDRERIELENAPFNPSDLKIVDE